MSDLEHLIADLPDAESARRFLSSLQELHRSDAVKLKKNEGLLSDVLTLVSYSPLLATTLLQNPGYLWWLNRKRGARAVRTKDELLESLGRFVLTNSQLDLHAQLARFRRRELMRIFLSDIRRLTTMAEITENISNLADAILETALRHAQQEMDNRFGPPQVVDDKGRKTHAEFCVVSLGKLGSRELNYSSDIDLLFMYSGEGQTSGTGSRGSVTNREYFVKLSETIVQIVGKQIGEGAAYRVDMRLRPHGRVGPLAISIDDAIRYYLTEARDWERQVLIRSRASAGHAEVYKRFFDQVDRVVFSEDVTVEGALDSVKRSKVLIDLGQKPEHGFNVKLGRGGIREIEFIAQALQLAYGGKDRWLRAPHTLISLARLADRMLITEAELTELFNAYEFLRHLEHILQMENGLQTHTVPDEPLRRSLIAQRMRFHNVTEFNEELIRHLEHAHRIFERVFGETAIVEPGELADDLATSDSATDVSDPQGGESDLDRNVLVESGAYRADLDNAIASESDFRHRLEAFRRRWSELIDNIKASELRGSIDVSGAKRAQTALAEASIDVALDITRVELQRKYHAHIERLQIAVIGLGKLGGGAIDYGSDLDLVLVHADDHQGCIPSTQTPAEFYARAAEIFVTTLSSMTRDGSIYRVDLRLRPYGKNGQSVISSTAFTEYMQESADVWEWLAYVKVRAVAGDIELGQAIEKNVREIIHARAMGVSPSELAAETRRVRLLLEKEKIGRRRSKDIDIKYGTGGMLDVYFAMRYLQLRHDVPDSPQNRSTDSMLKKLHEAGTLSADDYEVLQRGYRFLSRFDHELRLTVGRTTRLPLANLKALETIAERMQLRSANDLIERLTIHRIDIRQAFDNVLNLPL